MSMPAAPPHPPGQPYVQHGGPPPYLGAEWEAQPNRSRRVLILCHVGMLIHFPVHVAMFLAVFAFILAFSLVGEFVFVVFFFLEKPAFRLLDRGLGLLTLRPKWWATWRELRHEGEPGFPRDRIEAVLSKQKPKTTDAMLRAHLYRGIGPRAALEIAASYGWQLSDKVPVRPKVELVLRRAPGPADLTKAGPVG
ncbi:hypothetical protein [Streptomyces chrestomyceticus]|uniref:hypothetical protein n=1 Tax=Streptomyces chrestomyceticus TaxID=68185 RepID=UPI0019D01EF8|nr:hypothetical protein [Streptomyces chrestomyceticus]